MNTLELLNQANKLEDDADRAYDGNGRHEHYIKWIFKALMFLVRFQIMKNAEIYNAQPSGPRRTR